MAASEHRYPLIYQRTMSGRRCRQSGRICMRRVLFARGLRGLRDETGIKLWCLMEFS
jgi:hypothetical protein